jgi:hypothetical protein
MNGVHNSLSETCPMVGREGMLELEAKEATVTGNMKKQV